MCDAVVEPIAMGCYGMARTINGFRNGLVKRGDARGVQQWARCILPWGTSLAASCWKLGAVLRGVNAIWTWLSCSFLFKKRERTVKVLIGRGPLLYLFICCLFIHIRGFFPGLVGLVDSRVSF